MTTHTQFFAPGLLDGRTAVITGAGSGINKQIAMTYARAGAAVAIVGRDLEKARRAASEIAEQGGRAIGLSADVRNHEALQAALNQAHAEFGCFDIVIAGAAGNFVSTAADMSANGFKAVIDTDLVGTFNTFKGALRYIRKPGGVMCAISAVQSSMPTYAQAHVCAAKAGIDMLVRSLAVEWGADGVRCLGIAPGPVTETEGMARLAPQGEASWSRLLSSIPSGRGASRQEIADLALFLASDAGRYINGTVVPIDGGITAVGSLEFGRMLRDSLEPVQPRA